MSCFTNSTLAFVWKIALIFIESHKFTSKINHLTSKAQKFALKTYSNKNMFDAKEANEAQNLQVVKIECEGSIALEWQCSGENEEDLRKIISVKISTSWKWFYQQKKKKKKTSSLPAIVSSKIYIRMNRYWKKPTHWMSQFKYFLP